MTDVTCSIDGCEKRAKCRGWCGAHHERFRRWGDPLGGRGMMDPLDRFLSRFERRGDDECWTWLGALYNGYGTFTIGTSYATLAHRHAYTVFVGPIPDGLQIDHLCRNRACVNPAHLEPVTLVENIMRGESAWAVNARKTHCLRGHEFTPENTYHPPGLPNIRSCKACAALRMRRRRAAS